MVLLLEISTPFKVQAEWPRMDVIVLTLVLTLFCVSNMAVYTTTRVCLYHPATRMWLYPKTGILDTATLTVTYKAIQPHTREYS